jgi:hypothetical protein
VIQDVLGDLDEEGIVDMERLSSEGQDRQCGYTEDQQDRGSPGRLMDERIRR